MKTTDFSYAAGYIDGDGCFQIGNQIWGSHLDVVSIKKEPLIWFAEHFDGIIRAIQPRTSNRQISYHFRFSKKGLKFLPDITKYLVEKFQESSCFQDFRQTFGKEPKQPYIEKMKHLKEKQGLVICSIKDELTAIRNTISPSIEDFAYLAGYIDAECSLDINRTMQKKGTNFTYRPQLQCNNTKAPFFYWASRLFGGQFHFLDKTHIPNCRNQLLWRISNLQLDPILKGIHPFLITKKQHCEKMIEMREKIISGDKTDRETIYQQVRHLNSI